jgi:uncharacterized membrane protein
LTRGEREPNGGMTGQFLQAERGETTASSRVSVAPGLRDRRRPITSTPTSFEEEPSMHAPSRRGHTPRGSRGSDPSVSRASNLTSAERLLAFSGGTLLAAWGLRRRDAAGFAIALIAGALAVRGAQGRSELYRRLGVRRFAGAEGAANVIRGRGIHVERSVVVLRPIDDVYRWWRQFENLPRFMRHLAEVRPLGDGRYHWVAQGPLGRVSWNAEIVEEQVPWLLSWRSTPGSQVDNAGSVRFSPAASGRGTEVRVVLAYQPPAGVLGAAVARLLGREPGQQIEDDLRRFKHLMEDLELAPARG